MVKEAVGDGATNPFVKEKKHQGYADALWGEPVGIMSAIAFDEAMSLHFAQVIAQLINAVTLGIEAVSAE